MAEASLDSSSDILGVFEERAEYLSKEELYEWTAITKRDKQIQEKLKGPGAKLLSGPRGSGKSTLLKTAYYDLLRKGKVLSAYVNFSKSLALEPLFHKSGNAAQIFRQWVLAKIVKGLAESFRDRGQALPDLLEKLVEPSESLISNLETGMQPELIEYSLTPSGVLEKIEQICENSGFTRTVLLFDDAAHAFSLEQQRDFFEIFRELRSRKVSAKAAIYPGITSFSPNFHVGHEAEVIEAWYRPDQPEYLDFMREIFERRLPPRLRVPFQGNEQVIDFLALASSGLPRGFLNMLSDCLQIGDGEVSSPTRSRAMRAVNDYSDTTLRLFSSLSSKLPRFKNFIDVGKELESEIVASIRSYNKDKSHGKKAVLIALSEPIPQEVDKILRFFEYSGVLQKQSPVSRGVKGVFQRYLVNYSILVSENALSLGKSVSIGKIVEVLRNRDAHAFVRARANTLVGPDISERCILDLPPCGSCGSPRISEDQKFCMHCGQELSGASVYHDLLNAPVDELPLTKKKLDGIKEHTGMRRVQDILADDEQEILNVPSVGKIWAGRIKTYAEEFVSV